MRDRRAAILLGARRLVVTSLLALTLSCSRDQVQLTEPLPTPPTPPTSSGEIIVTVATSGVALDPDGYILTIDRVWNRRVTPNARESFRDLRAGQYVLELLSVTHNCITSEGSRRLINLPAGATVEVNLIVTCALPTDGDIYVGAAGMYDLFNNNHGSLTSRYVLYHDGVFGLQFSSLRHGDYEYLGRYVRADSLITFTFEGWIGTAESWVATGILRGDSLSVRYNLIMSLTDFIDGVYDRSPVTP